MASNETASQRRFRVKHTSGETYCTTLDEARCAQQEKPGAKIFRERQR